MPDLNTQSIEDASATKYGYGYVRVSTEKQEELSPESQAKLLREHRIFRPQGIETTGVSADDQPCKIPGASH